MNIYDLKRGESAEITAVDVQGAAGERLASLGVANGASITCLSYSVFKSSVLIAVGGNRIALRKSMASRIEVAK